MCYITAQYSTIQVDLHENAINNWKLTHNFHIHKILIYAHFSLLCRCHADISCLQLLKFDVATVDMYQAILVFL